MRAFIIISHGDLAAGLKMSVEMVVGARDDLFSLGLSPEGGPESLQQDLETLLSNLDEYEEVFVFTDLFGGSPGNTAFMRLAADPKYHIISGVNFPMVLTAVLTPDIDVDTLLNEAKNGIIDLKAALAEMDDDE
ncbi:MAG TPA: hypothetical protein VFC83_04145 [Erysipelotrichaceae bacterium]|nr:hypothetical protein [Erysipelotrichaceae bacterium]